MSVGIKVPNSESGADHFALLSHPDGGYALAVAGLGTYTYKFLNGANMTTPEAGESVAATTVEEASFTQKAGIFDGVKSQLLVNDDVQHNFEYKVINNSSKFAVSASQNNESAEAHSFAPYLPDAAQSPLLNMEDYQYYGFANHIVATDTYEVIPQTKLITLNGLYDDIVWVRYGDYSMDKTPFRIPNKKTIVDSHVARDPLSVDVSMNIEGGLPYNIIWYDDNMMSTDTEESTTISNGGSKDLSGDAKYIWYFTGNDPYNLKIEHKNTGYYIYSSDGSACALDASNYTPFMLLKKSGYDYGILQVTGGTNKLSGYGNSLVAGDPTKFVVFGLSVHDLIYRLIIAKTCPNKTADPLPADQYVDIPFKGKQSDPVGSLRIYGTTQRDLTTGTPAGATYQLGETIYVNDGSTTTPYNYSVDAGAVSIGDLLQVPNEFNRPNCTYEFYIDGVWDSYNSSTNTISGANDDLNGKYKGIKLNEVSPRLMSDADLIDKVVRVNIVYSFDKSLATNSGLDFVRSTDQNLWYTMETQEASEPQLARYTKTQGLTAIAGRETHYTNDYLFTPVGDVYGFKMYNRYTVKNSNVSNDDDQTMMMTSNSLTNTTPITIAEPGTGDYTSGNEIYELISGDVAGYFRVHPVANTKEQTQVYIKKDVNALKLSTTPQDWTFGLDIAMLQPYYLGAGNVGGLNDTGKALYKTEIDKGEGNYKITDLQNIVYNDDNIVHFSTGYYRLHSQPGISGISPVRYASGYLHEIEKTAGDESTPIPMHFYSRSGVNGTFNGDLNPLKTGFTETAATRGDIPVPSTETDPSTIFRVVNGDAITNRTISNVTMSTQGLNVIQNKMGTGTATTYRLIDIGGGVVVLVNTTSGTNYLNFKQTDDIYDLKFSDANESRMDDVKWCMEPANNLGLKVTTNNGGDGYYYTTFYAPFDVLLPADADPKTYNAYISSTWNTVGLNMDKVPANSPHDAGKFVPAGTPVVIRTNDESGSVKLSLSNTTSPAISTCIFKGKYLEQLLDLDATHDVYTLGLPFVSDVTKEGNYNTTGNIHAPTPEQDNTGVGFYINATPYKEADALQSLWQRNNRYVLHNKIYYRATGSGSRELSMRGIEFVPIIFDDDLEGGEQPGEEEQNPSEGASFQGDGCIYDMMGRKVATRQQVEDGSWRLLRPGIYILNGKKFRH